VNYYQNIYSQVFVEKFEITYHTNTYKNIKIFPMNGIYYKARLALYSNHRNVDHASNTSAVSNNSNLSILVVDDERDIINLISRLLQKDGQKRVCAFTDPIAALEHFSTSNSGKDGSSGHHHSIVISDIRMPSMNGYEFVNLIKKINPQVKIILMSAFEIEDKEFHNVLPDIKVDGFLQKPFSITQLNDLTKKITTTVC
jgi:CheY-like chemotaxis protein